MSEILSLFQFSKGERKEIHTYAQFTTGSVIEFTMNPPAVNPGSLGSAVFSTAGVSANQVPASWGVILDNLIYSNGIDQHQIYPGDQQQIAAFVWVEAGDGLQRIPETGYDLTDVVLQDNDDYVEINLGHLAIHGLYIATYVPANKFSWKIRAGADNNVNNLIVQYVNNKGNFTVVSGQTDTTDDGSGSLNQDGDMTWDHPTDEAPFYMFGLSAYWYKLDFQGLVGSELDEAQPTYITYSGDWRPMQNVWDGILIDVIEAQFYDDADDVFDTYPASTINIGGMTSDDELYISTTDPAYGFYFDVGSTPNSNGGGFTIERWNGDDFVGVTNTRDQTGGLQKSGFVTWEKDDIAKKSQFNGTRYYAYWYKITINLTIDDSVIVSATYLPTFDIGKELGDFGICNGVWKNRAVYTNSIFDRDIYVSASGRWNVLNGVDFAILEPGDGRRNRTVCIKKFHNEIIAWQVEKGRDGGCTTLFEGYNPATFGKLVLSSQVGTFNAKSAVVIDGATTTTKNDDKFQTMAYWISHYGIFMTDGRIVTMVSQDIQNYFDSDFEECIRLGYENEMWVEHDIDRGVLRFGLVSGPTAEEPNVFPIFDLEDGTWSFDTFAVEDHHLSCALQCEAESDQFPIIHIGAGVNAIVYLLNETLNDDGEAIDFHLVLELNHYGFCLDLREANLRMRVQDAGGLVKNIYENSRLITEEAETLTFVAEQTGDALKRHRVFERIYEETNISLELRENTVDQDVYLYDLNMDISAVLNK